MAVLGTPIIVDGSHGEGGGALFRTAIAMAALTQQPLRLTQIRGGTPYPGLDAEDLTIAKAIAASSSAETLGLELGSTNLSFLPTSRPGRFPAQLDRIEGGGRSPSGPVVLASLLPILARLGIYSAISIEGETHGQNTLSYDAFAATTIPALRKFGLHAFPELRRAGYGRESMGEIQLQVEPSALSGVAWGDRGALRTCTGVVTTSDLPLAVGMRAKSHLEHMANSAGIPLRVSLQDIPSDTVGACVTLSAEYERGFGGAAVHGQKGLRIESIAQRAFVELTAWMESNTTVDAHLADQILVVAAIAEGSTTFSAPCLTQRLLTTIWVIKQFLPIHITVRGREGQPGTLSIHR